MRMSGTRKRRSKTRKRRLETWKRRLETRSGGHRRKRGGRRQLKRDYDNGGNWGRTAGSTKVDLASRILRGRPREGAGHVPGETWPHQVPGRKPEIEDLDVYATSREQRFRMFASFEYEGQLYMTPRDFLESVTTDEPRIAKQWKSLSNQELTQMLLDTPPVWKGSSKLFRNLRDKGVISYTEYLFLLCILTKPHAGFKIAFNMFDTDGNQMVDKKEFLVLQEIFRKKNEKKDRKGDEEKCAQLRLQLYGYLATTNGIIRTDVQDHGPRSLWDTLRRSTSQALFSDLAERADEFSGLLVDTTLLVHFFGKKGKAELNFEDFYRFMDNLQTEILEIEFLTYSKGMNAISEEDFAHILLRYTNVENTSSYLENVRQRIPEEKGITFDEFRSFFQFLNNLEDFAIAMQMYNFASRSIGQDEFKRAVYVATGSTTPRIPGLQNSAAIHNVQILPEEANSQIGTTQTWPEWLLQVCDVCYKQTFQRALQEFTKQGYAKIELLFARQKFCQGTTQIKIL
ncbi:hypothetical protein NDU88_002915 [Pleurodeles waltl]|uniref:EF-hand domain-containing protein n=1 Tax=Pleurodeles waltl TaxID=8319 RepID=A0AAV7WR98_PLEWA|nr:hypothetical protein NDU88_002915 [Pleurodeles waltl]